MSGATKANKATLAAARAAGVTPKPPKVLADLKPFRETLGLTAEEMARKAGNLSAGSLHNLEFGRLAPNSRAVAMFAPLYGLKPEALGKMMKREPMSEAALATSERRAGQPMPRRKSGGNVLYGGHTTNGNGNGHKPYARTALKKVLDGREREDLRLLTNTANVNAMKGVKETTVPTSMVLLLLKQYYRAIGVEGNLTVDAVFDRLFDL